MFPVEDLDEPVLAELHTYWKCQCQGRTCPSRSDIDPIEIPHLLPHIALTEIVEARSAEPGFRIRYRLAGTKIEEHFGCTLTNHYLDDLIEGPFIEYINRLYRKLIETWQPHYSESRFGSAENGMLRAKRLLLPLSANQQKVNMVLAGLIFFNDLPNRRRTVVEAQGEFVPPRNRSRKAAENRGTVGA